MKKSSLLMAIIMMVSVVVVGCGPSSGKDLPANTASVDVGNAEENNSIADETVNEKDPAEYKGTIAMWTQDGTTDKEMAKEFNKVYPNVKVNITPIPENYPVKLSSALASGSGVPDVVTLEFNFISKFVETDQFQILGEAPYNCDRFKDDMIEYMYKLGQNSKGQQIGMPVDPAPAGMFYRRDIAKQYLGTDSPEEVAKLINTWDDVIEVGKQIKEKSDGKVSVLTNAAVMFSMIKLQSGKEWIDENKKVTIETDFLTAARTTQKAIQLDVFAKIDDWTAPWYATFSKGDIMFYPEGLWLEGYIIKDNDKEGSGRWAVTKFPGGCINRGGVNLAIPKKAQNKELAWEFIKWYTTTTEAALTTQRMTGGLSSYKPVYDNPAYHEPDQFLGGQKVIEFFMNEMNNNMIVPPVTPYDPILEDAVNKYIKPFSEGSITPEVMLEQITDEVIQKIPGSSR